ncbi:hypothetical protein TRICI_002412 [Trichomonascus ciferrii]|uniref:Fumarylacetoacetase-like C-terminal domain-containing protein n=1 Tax=Trichomonascus ciferrii TaxID=44093 RepID=A0A642VC15_9ASCO|nr:hypothetical protein TRICI_002412 [Trichomonascus ciferrii]
MVRTTSANWSSWDVGLDAYNDVEIKMYETTGTTVISVPILFAKPRITLIGPYPALVNIPKVVQDGTSDYEAELFLVIGKPGRDVPEKELWNMCWATQRQTTSAQDHFKDKNPNGALERALLTAAVELDRSWQPLMSLSTRKPYQLMQSTIATPFKMGILGSSSLTSKNWSPFLFQGHDPRSRNKHS